MVNEAASSGTLLCGVCSHQLAGQVLRIKLFMIPVSPQAIGAV